MDFPGIILVLLILANVMLLPFFVYLLLVSSAALATRLRRGKRESVSLMNEDGPELPRYRFQVVIPAHDEAWGITTTVQSCLRLNYPEQLFDVVVIADNCTDQTAALARLAGAGVLERSHPTDRSKGHALRFYFDRLFETGESDRLDAVVVIDADSVVDPDLLQHFVLHLDRGHDWIQAFDTVLNTDDSWRTRLMTYAFALINGVYLLGQTALGLSGGFRGNGMCFSTRGLRRHPWRPCGLVEDLEYSWLLRVAGEKISFAPEGAVRAEMLAQGGTAAANQRRRWEFGRSELKWRMIGPLLRSKHMGVIEKIAATVELTMPTMLSLLSVFVVSCLSGLMLIALSLPPIEGSLLSFLWFFNAVAACGLILYGLSPFSLFHVPWHILFGLFYLPYYAAWKVIMLFRGTPKEWIRTVREHRAPPRNDAQCPAK